MMATDSLPESLTDKMVCLHDALAAAGLAHVALFKAFFNRTKDWADLEAMRDAGTLDVEQVRAVLIHYLGDDDERLAPLAALEA